MDYRIKTITRLLKSNMEKRVTLQEFSEAMNISYCYLSLLFKKEMGRSFSEYSRLLRIRYSKLLLRLSDIEIKEISYKTGYSNISQFYADFKIIEELTPKHYRNKFNNTFYRKISEQLDKKQK